MWRIMMITVVMTVLVPSAWGESAPFPAKAIEQVKAAHQAYVEAWLSNDPKAIMATLTDDAILMPHHGVAPVVGKDAIQAFWFPPDAPPTKVTRIVNSVTEVDGQGDLAFVWGRSELVFEYDGKTYSNEGNYLSILRRGDDGRWRISRRMWNDPVPDVN